MSDIIFALEAFSDWCFEQVHEASVLQILLSNLLVLLPVMLGHWVHRLQRLISALHSG